PLRTLAGLLLEPRSEDSLATWNYFDTGLANGGDFPVLRLPAAVPLTVGPVRPLAEDRRQDRPISKDAYLKAGRGFNFAGNPVSGLTWLDDGEHFLQTKGDQLYKVHARTGRAVPFVDPAKLAKSLAGLPAGGGRAGQGRGTSYHMDPQRTGDLIEYENDLYFA